MGIDSHMLLRTKHPIADQRVNQLAWELAASFGHQNFYVTPNNTRALYTVPVYYQDGPEIIPEPGETLIRVNVVGRWCDIYSLNSKLFYYAAVAQWLERRVPGCEIWYGGDSSGVLAIPFTPKVRAQCMKHMPRFHLIMRDPPEPDGQTTCEFCSKNRAKLYLDSKYLIEECLGCQSLYIQIDGQVLTDANQYRQLRRSGPVKIRRVLKHCSWSL